MTQPNALFLADILEDGGKPADIAEKCAAELRRLHAELERCKQVCAATSEGWRSDTDVWKAQRDALLEALLRIESAVDWYLGRSSFTQTTQLKGLEHSANVRKELFAAHDEARAAIKAAEENT